MNTSVSDLTLPASPALAQCTGLEMGEIFRGDTSVLEDASLVWLEEPVLVEPYLEEAPFKDLCGDIVMGSATPNIGLIDSICTKLLDLTPLLPLYFPPPPLMCMQFMSPYATLEVIIQPLTHIAHT